VEKATLKESKKHTKHTALIKPVGGEYHRNEWALLGAPCGIINQFAEQLAAQLKKEMQVGYIDASHQEIKSDHPYSIYYYDKQAFAQIDTHVAFAQMQNRKYFDALDILLINGNHFVGDKQIVFINDKKKDSLRRKLSRLTDLRIIIVDAKEQEIYDFLEPYISDNVQVVQRNEIAQVVDIMAKYSQSYLPQLKGLVLAGGKSQRMGSDKGVIDYYGKPQREYEADLISELCEEVFLSLSQNQTDEAVGNYSVIKDTFVGLGPYGAILSAFREYPNHAWLTVACDLPLLNKATLDLLVAKRNPSKLATCFHNPETKFPEPLITIWEPRAYPVLLEFLSQGYSCPRKVLINTEIEEIVVEQVDFMINVNDPQALSAVKEILKK